MRQLLRNLAYAILPRRFVRILRNRLLVVPGDYRDVIDEVESVMALKSNGTRLDDDYWSQMLRKYAHIIDKGLQRCDRESGHSLELYEFAKEALSRVESESALQDPSVVWAAQKISEYEQFQSKGTRPPTLPPPDTTPCDYAQMSELIKARRSVRQYAEKEVPIDITRKIVEGVDWAPTSCNRQPAKVFVARDQALVRACLSTCKGATGFSEFVPCFLAFCADLRSYEMPREMLLPTIDVSLGAQNCCLLAHSLGLGITLLSWAYHSDEEESQLRQLLEIPSYYRIVVNGVLGYPEYGAPMPLRKAVESTCILR